MTVDVLWIPAALLVGALLGLIVRRGAHERQIAGLLDALAAIKTSGGGWSAQRAADALAEHLKEEPE